MRVLFNQDCDACPFQPGLRCVSFSTCPFQPCSFQPEPGTEVLASEPAIDLVFPTSWVWRG